MIIKILLCSILVIDGWNIIRSFRLNSVKHNFHLHSSNDFQKKCFKLYESTLSQLEQDNKEQELIARISREVMLESGVELDQLINPSKVVNLERDIVNLTDQLRLTDSTVEKEDIQSKIDKKKSTLSVEKRAVMRDWLKNLFVGQSIIAVVISLLMVYDIVPYYEHQLPLSIKVLGFWMWWLFIIPSLRLVLTLSLNLTNNCTLQGKKACDR